MNRNFALNAVLTARFELDRVVKWQRRCTPRVLMLVDGLDYRPDNGFGLWRFIHALTVAPGVALKPTLTLAHRTTHATANITVGTDVYPVHNNFNFAAPPAGVPAVTLANFDQIWVFGIAGGAFGLNNAEVAVISEFMNSGGGYFATGDHASLGRQLSGDLPRIRHMREWRDAASGGIPMGTEADATLAVRRIDTVVNPGSDGLYEFRDQSDDIPQRIYPRYKVVDTDGLAGSAWSASVHPLLMLPGAAATRTDSSGFVNDIDVLPDHPHESVCFAVAAPGVLGGAYNLHGQNFAEFQPLATAPATRLGSEIVAHAVSGGRSVLNGAWKPPVSPRMFGVISAYDGRLVQAYPGKAQRPGRIVCDSTWHHFVNINLDGTDSGRTGLGTGSGATFAPSPDLLKIHAYYRNTLNWLQPANRTWCSIFWDLVATRFNPLIIEELIDPDRLTRWRDLVGLGREARSLITHAVGSQAMRDQVLSVLSADKRTEDAANALTDDANLTGPLDPQEMIDGLYGAMLAHVARVLPMDVDTKRAETVLAEGVEPHIKPLQDAMVKALRLAVDENTNRLERGRVLLSKLAGLK